MQILKTYQIFSEKNTDFVHSNLKIINEHQNTNSFTHLKKERFEIADGPQSHRDPF